MDESVDNVIGRHSLGFAEKYAGLVYCDVSW